MLKKVIIVFLIIAVILSSVLVYLNKVFLPEKIKHLLVQGLAKQTQKSVRLNQLQINLFRGLVLKQLIIYDQKHTIASIEEASCTFLILPFLKKEIVIPALRINSAQIFLHRRADNTFNIAEMFAAGQEQKTKNFNIYIKKVAVRDSVILFQDDVVKPAFQSRLENVNLDLALAIPALVKFNFKAHIPSQPLQEVSILGTYDLIKQSLHSRVAIKGLSLKDYYVYYKNSGITATSGLADLTAEVDLKAQVLAVNLEAVLSGAGLTGNGFEAALNSEVDANVNYDLKAGKSIYSGKAIITKSRLDKIAFVGQINNIEGIFNFNNAGISSEKLSGQAFGVAMDGQLRLADFNSPRFVLSIDSAADLSVFYGILKEKFDFQLAMKILGPAKLMLILQSGQSAKDPVTLSGMLEFKDTRVDVLKPKCSLENASGKVDFGPDSLKWENFKFAYQGQDYISSGTVKGYKAPDIDFKLSSKYLQLGSKVTIKDKIITIRGANVKYFNSQADIAGAIDLSRTEKVAADLSAKSSINLSDLNNIFPKQLVKAKPEGNILMDVSFFGDMNNFRLCTIKGKATSSGLSLFGLKSNNFSALFNQGDGVLDVPSTDISMYDGLSRVSAKVDFNKEGTPYTINIQSSGIKLDQLKADTVFKDKELAGVVEAKTTLKGLFSDINKLNGTGSINIKEGKFWQLDLFQGLGKLIFAKDFANIVFKEGSCSFIVKDSNIYSKDVRLMSSLTELTGSCRIGFDSTIDASINVQVNDSGLPVTGTFKDVTTAIIGSATRFGVISISGNLKGPKYTFKPAVVDILKSIKNAILQ